ncbi:hypothetical protein FVER14953_20381 [Fusarium verticillioides]|nr:hypothetical protein FVER14953_20381 [Fusarium verticillioides]
MLGSFIAHGLTQKEAESEILLQTPPHPPQGDTWNEKFIPGGTKIGYCAWGIFRREDIWGSDAGEFRPERWLESKGEKLRERESALELIFSYGRWQCLGRPVALMELNKVYVELLRRFDFTICDHTKPWTVFNCGIFSQSELMVRVHRRD